MSNHRIIFLLSFVLINRINLYSTQGSTKTNLYSKLSQYNHFISDSSFYLNEFNSISKLKCISYCTNTPECVYLVSNQNEKCFIFKRNFSLFLKNIPEGNSIIYQKQFNKKKSLINYWTFNQNLNDQIGNSNMYGGVNAALTFDRFGRANSSLSLVNGYYRVPAGVYFSGTQMTVMGWVKVRNIRVESRLIDFGNGMLNENIVLSLSQTTNGRPYLYFRSGNNEFYGYTTRPLILNQWQHLACVFSFPYYSIYIDGIEATSPGSKTSLNSFSFANVVRTSNFIGRSNWFGVSGAQDADADFDDLKIFNQALSQQEIQFEMNNNY
jgi:hypothetical protein